MGTGRQSWERHLTSFVLLIVLSCTKERTRVIRSIFFFNEIKIKTVLRAQNYLVNHEERTEPSSARLPPAVPDMLHGHPLVKGVPA